MQIFLGESDAFLHSDGRAHMIIVHVTLESGKKVQFPYPAENPISELYESVKNIADEKVIVPSTNTIVAQASVVHVKSPAGEVVPVIVSSPIISDNEIHRECLVRCVKVNDRGKGATVDLEVGKIYRVLTINGPTSPEGKKFAMSYDLVDDAAGNTLRIFALPDEVIFYQKRKPPIPKILKKGKSDKCGLCAAEMIFYKDSDGRFMGDCPVCHNRTESVDGKPKSETSAVDVTSGDGASVPASV